VTDEKTSTSSRRGKAQRNEKNLKRSWALDYVDMEKTNFEEGKCAYRHGASQGRFSRTREKKGGEGDS